MIFFGEFMKKNLIFILFFIVTEVFSQTEDCFDSEKFDLIFTESINYIYGNEKQNIDLKKAEENLNKLAKCDYNYAKFMLCFLNKTEILTTEIEKKYCENTVIYSESENGISELLFGLNYLYGINFNKDYQKAFEYFEKSSLKKNSIGMFYMGFINEYGFGVEENYKTAIEFYEKSIASNNCYALYNLGVMYQNIYGVKQDYKKAINYYKKSAECGNDEAMYSIGFMYENGYGVIRDYKQSYEYYKKSALKGNINGNFKIGYYLKNGYGVKKDINKAIEYLKKAGEKEHLEAQNLLAETYYNGEGIKQNYKEAYYWFEKCSNNGYSFCQYYLGMMYENSFYIEKNIDIASYYYYKAAKNGNSFGIERALVVDYKKHLISYFQTALNNYYGLNKIEINKAKGIEIFNKLVEVDYIYATGILCDIDKNESYCNIVSEKEKKEKIDERDDMLLFTFANFLINSEETKEKAINYYKKSIEKDNIYAFLKLFLYYLQTKNCSELNLLKDKLLKYETETTFQEAKIQFEQLCKIQ